MIFLTAFVTGLLSSLHCVGMCGPIALSTPVVGNKALQVFSSKLVYNIGRIIVYGFLGFLFGTFGAGLKIAGLQQSVSIAAGILMVFIAFINTNHFERFFGKITHKFISTFFAKLVHQKTYTALLSIGLLNGLLPCGFVYLALLGAVSTQNVLHGTVFMVLFGFGTLPLMLTVSIAGNFVKQTTRTWIRKLLPFFVFILGCLFILRGLNLGIPYLSPEINKSIQIDPNCE